jgi:aerobic-type carbon monoxide dehydrogenase small subunit (CoxS/CutS family)
VPEPDQRQPLAITLETPPGVDARTLARALLAFLQEEYGADVETRHEADGQAGRYVVHIDRKRVRANPTSDEGQR